MFDDKKSGRFPALSAMIRPQTPSPEANGEADTGKPRKQRPFPPEFVSAQLADQDVLVIGSVISMKEMEWKYVAWVIQRCDGDKEEAARLMGISSRTIYNMATEWRLRSDETD